MRSWPKSVSLIAWSMLCLTVLPRLAVVAAEPAVSVEPPDAIVVCPAMLQPALKVWLERRTAEGLSVRVVTPGESAEALRERLAGLARVGTTRYVLLIGDPRRIVRGQVVGPGAFVPTIYAQAEATATYQQTTHLPGDHLYGDFNRDGIIDAAVGRLPVRSLPQAREVLSRIAAYEDSQDFGAWRSRVELVAGLGGFGPLIDGAIETVAAGMITGALPGSVRTRVTHAGPSSPFCPGPECFTETVLANYAEGSRFWVYAGHGHVCELDRVPATAEGRPVLCVEDVARLNRPSESAPIALLLACYTGAFDADEDCLATRMLLAPGGPVAVLAGSRVTMPYGNAAAAMALIHAVYEHRPERLGDAWIASLLEMSTSSAARPELQARRGVIDSLATLLGGTGIDAERREHMQLYNWLGDPTMRMTHPQTIEFTAPARATAGETLLLTGESPLAGTLTIGVHRRLAATPKTLPSQNAIRPHAGLADADDSARRSGEPTTSLPGARDLYHHANETLLAESRVELLSPGPWEATILLPQGTTGPVRLVVEIEGLAGHAEGVKQIWVRP